MRHDTKLAILGGAPIRSRPWPSWPRFDEGTERSLLGVLRSGRWAVSGAYAGETCWERKFAGRFAEFHGVPYCTPTTSGTGSLTLALLALGVGPGDEVLVPGLTWVACASVVLAVGAVPILVDVEPDTLAMSVSAARAALGPKTRAIMLVHPFCTLADVDAFVALAAETGIPIIEDCSQAHGAELRGRKVGTFGAVGCFSMQQSKVLTSGEGGAVVTRDPAIYDRVEQLRADGRVFSDRPRLGQLELLEVGAVQGRNMCLSEFQAAVLCDRLAVLSEENAHRAARARTLETLLGQVDGVSTLHRSSEVTAPVYYNFVIRFDLAEFQGCSIDTLARALGAELDTRVFPVYRPMNVHPLYRPLDTPRGTMPDTEWLRRDPSRFSLPAAETARATCLTLTHPVFLDDDASMDEIARAVLKVKACASDLLTLPQGSTRDAF